MKKGLPWISMGDILEAMPPREDKSGRVAWAQASGHHMVCLRVGTMIPVPMF